MNGQTVLITGGARRLGRAMTSTLASADYRVVVQYNTSHNDAEELVQNIRGYGGEAYAVQASLTDEASCTGLIKSAIEKASDIHHLINNASIFPEDTIDTLTTDSFLANTQLHTLVPLMLARTLKTHGTLKTVTNLLDTRNLDYDREHASYHLSKRGLHSLTSMMALEWAPETRVNGVAPGLILPPEGKTTQYLEDLKHTNPLNTYGDPDDIARAVHFLLTNEFITGQTLYVDGGRHLKGRVYE